MFRWLTYRDLQNERRQRSAERTKRRARFARKWEEIQGILDKVPDCDEKRIFIETMRTSPPNCPLSWMAANEWVRQLAVLNTWRRIEHRLSQFCETIQGS